MIIAVFYMLMSSLKKILIIDEDNFSRVCSAILNDEGYQIRLAVSLEDADRVIHNGGISLVVSSYPYAQSFLKSKKFRGMPTIVLSNELNDDLIEVMKNIENSICLLKPLDFERFKYIVRGIINGYLNLSGGNILA
ncbi:MAG: DNA-binding response regulator [Deferribacteres bacterium]|nr:DNA-binding response regulator [Deferribacteres bacterium]